MSIHIRDSSQYRTALQAWVRDAVGWKEAIGIWVHNGTEWKKAFTKFTVAPTNISVFDYNPGLFTFGSDGSLPYPYNSWGTPLTAGIGAAYQFKFVGTYDNGGQGGSVSGPTSGVWYSMSGGIGFYAYGYGATISGTYSIREGASGPETSSYSFYLADSI
jgi:hypothetical protein